MRTKTLLAAAALVAAGALTSQAQNVYSLNVVGYVNLTLKPGYNLVANQFSNSTTLIANVLTNITGLPDGSTFFSWNAGAQDFTQPANWIGTPPDGPAWYNADYTAFATATAPRGNSYFIYNAGNANATLTLVGEVPQGTTSVAVPNNYGFLADVTPTSGQILTNGFPIADDSTIALFDATAQDYTQPLNGIATPPDGPAWYNADFTAVVPFAPAVGQGFLYRTIHGASTWNRNFTVR
jgi:hypothetical protein